jgi:hypothetical protein
MHLVLKAASANEESSRDSADRCTAGAKRHCSAAIRYQRGTAGASKRHSHTRMAGLSRSAGESLCSVKRNLRMRDRVGKRGSMEKSCDQQLKWLWASLKNFALASASD